MGATELLIVVKAIGVNLFDLFDFAGTVSSIRSNVPPTTGIKVEDRVAGFLRGACSRNDRPGAFVEYLVIAWGLVFKVPDHVLDEEAASVSLVALTAAQGLWYRLGLQAPFEYDKASVLVENPAWTEYLTEPNNDTKELNIFIYGASTSVALHAVQIARMSAKASGKTLKLYGAASKARFEMLKSEPYAYDHLVHYLDADWPAQIIQVSNGTKLDYVYNAISEDDSVVRAASTLKKDGKIAIVRSREAGAWTSQALTVKPIYGAVWEGLGEEVQYSGFTLKKSPAARAFAVEFYKWLTQVIGPELTAVPVRLMPEGLDRVVQDGFKLLGTGAMNDRESQEEYMKPVSAEKVVHRI